MVTSGVLQREPDRAQEQRVLQRPVVLDAVGRDAPSSGQWLTDIHTISTERDDEQHGTSTAIGAAYSIPSRRRLRLTEARGGGVPATAGRRRRHRGGDSDTTVSRRSASDSVMAALCCCRTRRRIAAAEHGVDHGRRPGAVGVVVGLAEVDRDRRLALAGELVEHAEPRILLGVGVVGEVGADGDVLVLRHHVDLRLVGQRPGDEVPGRRRVLAVGADAQHVAADERGAAAGQPGDRGDADLEVRRPP